MRFIPLLSIALALVPAFAQAGELVMFETEGCPYCAAWNRDVGQGYGKTDAARKLPLRRIDLKAPRPAGYEQLQGIRLSPTFVVMACGEEIERIQGYSDNGLFWSQIEMALSKVKSREAKGGCP